MVDWEWRTALKFKGIEGIDPHPLDPVADAPPPEELKDLHFRGCICTCAEGNTITIAIQNKPRGLKKAYNKSVCNIRAENGVIGSKYLSSFSFAALP